MELILDNTSWFIILLSLISFSLLLLGHWNRKQLLPPGPKGWPIVGNIFDISMLPHRSLYDLKHKYGPVVWLNLGSRKTMAILSANTAMELYKKHDLSFIDRSVVHTVETHGYYKSSMAFSPFNGHWRALRRLCTTELFISKQMKSTKIIRQECVNNILSWIQQEVGSNIELTKFVFPSLFNMVGNLVLSRDLVDPYSNMFSDFYTAVAEIMDCMGRPNISDVFPWLRWLDLQGLRKKMDNHFGKALNIVTKFLEERMDERQRGGEKKNDFLDYMLDFEGNLQKDEPANFSRQNISLFVLLEIFLAGTETISTSIEWVMSELLSNPEMMIKTKDELDRVVGLSNPEMMIKTKDELDRVVGQSISGRPH